MSRALVVDDNTQIRLLVTRVLESMGCAVVQAADAAEALRQAAADPVDLVVTDVSLQSGRSGLWLGDQIARRYPDARILYVSGHDRVQVLRMAAAESVPTAQFSQPDAFLPKPFGLRDLRDAVAALLPRRTADPLPGSAS